MTSEKNSGVWEKHLREVMEEGTNTELLTTPEVQRILAELVPVSIDNYHKLLERELRELEPNQLGEAKQKELDLHLQELKTLQAMLKEYARDPQNFDYPVRQTSEVEGKYTAGPRRKSDRRFGEGRENAQTQLRLHLQTTPEDYQELIRAESLKGLPPQEVLRRAGRSSTGISINTTLVYRSPASGRTMLEPQAGIRITRLPDRIEFFGLTWEGTTPHYTGQGEVATPEGFGPPEFTALQNLVKALSGYKI